MPRYESYVMADLLHGNLNQNGHLLIKTPNICFGSLPFLIISISERDSIKYLSPPFLPCIPHLLTLPRFPMTNLFTACFC